MRSEARQFHTDMKLYNLPYSHHSSKIHIVLLEKKLAFELMDVSGLPKTQFSGTYNPNGQVPFLEDGQFAMGESAVILEYLDDMYPVPAMVPRHAVNRAEARWLVRFHDSELAPVLSHIFGELNSDAKNEERLSALGESLQTTLDEVEQRINPQPYWQNDSFGMVDASYAMSLWYSHWLSEQLGSPMDSTRYPKLNAWSDELANRASCATVFDGCMQALGLNTDSQQQAA